jgi:hypothetical protein
MKKSSLIILAGILTSIICCYVGWTSLHPSVASKHAASTRDTTPLRKSIIRRLNIAFILGEDKETDNPYYDEAYRYYTTNPEGKTDYVVTTCRSLLEVKQYLQKNKAVNNIPWGEIHLVSHGNQWTGLSVKVTPDSKRATTQRIVEHTASDLFESLTETVVDTQSKIFLHGCGVGNNRALVDAVGSFFSSKNNRPLMFAPKLFEYYVSTGSDKNLQSQRYLAQSWFVSYPMEDKPSIAALTNELREKYPEARVDWQSALSREQSRWIGDVYHYTFEVPVKWIIPVDSVQDLREGNKIAWLNQQQQIVDELKVLQLPIEKFNWSLTSGYTETKDGHKVPAIFVKGYCTMLCVLQVLTNGSQNNRASLQKPFAPELTDARFYYYSPQNKLAGI